MEDDAPVITVKIEPHLDCEALYNGESSTENLDTNISPADIFSRSVAEMKDVDEAGFYEDKGDCEECKLVDEGYSPMHGSQVYIDNAEVYYRSSRSEHLDTKIGQGGLDVNMAVNEEVSWVVPCRGDTDQCSRTQCCCHSDNMQKDETSLYRTTQHEVFSESLSEHNINSLMAEVSRNGDVSCMTAVGAREEHPPLRLTEKEMSMTVTDCQKMSLVMNITQNTDNVSLPSVESSRLSEHESCVSETNIKIESEICSETCDTISEMLVGSLSYNCDVCGVVFSQMDSLKRHRIIHTDEKPYKCDVCGLECPYKSKLKNHQRTHTGERPYKCDVCGVGFSHKDNLTNHKLIHTGEKPYKCDICSVGFSRKSHLKGHKRIHTSEKPYKCDICGLGFNQKVNIRRHKRIHTGERPYKCDVCGVKFSHINSLKNHKRTHLGDKPYMCDVCGVRFSQTCHLKSHKIIHTRKQSFKNDVCDGEFYDVCHMQRQKKICTKDKPYKCEICSANFSYIGSLRNHKRNHTEEMPYKCDVCGIGYSRTGNLIIHKRIHTGEKPYKCDVCDVGFSQVGHLMSHKKVHTEEKS